MGNLRESENVQKNESELEKELDQRQLHAMLLVKSVANPMSFGTMDTARLERLRRISPYECPLPQDIVKVLLENCRDNEFWTNLLYLDDRYAISQILCRHLLFAIMNTPDIEHFDKNTVDVR